MLAVRCCAMVAEESSPTKGDLRSGDGPGMVARVARGRPFSLRAVLDGSKWRVFGGFDVRGREARIPTGDEVVFSQLEVAAEEDFGLAWGS